MRELRPDVVSEAKRLHRRSPKTGERRYVPVPDSIAVMISPVTRA